MVGHRTVNAAVAGSSPAIRAISLFQLLSVHVFALLTCGDRNTFDVYIWSACHVHAWALDVL